MMGPMGDPACGSQRRGWRDCTAWAQGRSRYGRRDRPSRADGAHWSLRAARPIRGPWLSWSPRPVGPHGPQPGRPHRTRWRARSRPQLPGRQRFRTGVMWRGRDHGERLLRGRKRPAHRRNDGRQLRWRREGGDRLREAIADMVSARSRAVRRLCAKSRGVTLLTVKISPMFYVNADFLVCAQAGGEDCHDD